MSCNITKGRRKKCKDNLGGVKEIYIARYIDYAITDHTAELGVELFEVPTRFFYRFELDGVQTSFSDNLSVNDEGNFYNSNLTTSFIKLDEETAKELNILDGGLFHIIVKLNSGKYYFLGFENGMELSQLDVVSGTNLSDFQGYNLAFTGKEQHKGMLISNLSDVGILTGIDGVFVWGLRQNNEVISDNNNLIKSDFNE